MSYLTSCRQHWLNIKQNVKQPLRSRLRLRHSTHVEGCNSLPQLLQITNGFFFPSVLQFEISSFSYEGQVCSRSGLWKEITLTGLSCIGGDCDQYIWLHVCFDVFLHCECVVVLWVLQTVSVTPEESLLSHQQMLWDHKLDTNLFRLVMLNSLFENVDSAVDVFFMRVHRYQSWNLRSQQQLKSLIIRINQRSTI